MANLAARAAWVVGLALLAVSHAAAGELPTLIQVSTANFSATVEAVGKDYDWLLLEFYAHWCPACKHFQPAYIQVAEHMAARGRAAPTVAVARVDCPDNEELCNKFEITGYPTMLLAKPDKFAARKRKEVSTLEPNPRSRDGVLRAIAKELGTSVDLPAGGKSGGGGATDGAARGSGGVRLPPGNAPADANDIEGATVKSWDYLTSAQMLKGAEARAALSEWLDLLGEAHPVGRCREGAATAAEILVTAWPPGTEDAAFPAALHDVQICGASEFKEWSGCKGSLPSSRGFTCGVWTLFHSLAAGLPEDDPQAGAWWLAAVRGYVKHFFQCSDCARHFVKAASGETASAVASKREAVMWMWRAHNSVNERLKKEEAEGGIGDPAFPKAPWPAREACASCRGGGGGGGEWNEDAVYAFLLKHYAAGTGEYAGSGAGRRGGGDSGRPGVGFGRSWSLALALSGGVAAAAYAVLRHSGQYAYRKAITRKL